MVLPMAMVRTHQKLPSPHLSGLQAPVTGASQKAQTTHSSSPRPPGHWDVNPGSRKRHARAWAGSQAVTTAATTMSIGAVSIWWTSTPSGTGWSAWCVAVHWPHSNWAPSRGTSDRSTLTPCCGVLLTRTSSVRDGRATWVWEGVSGHTALLLDPHLRKKRSNWTQNNMLLVSSSLSQKLVRIHPPPPNKV